MTTKVKVPVGLIHKEPVIPALCVYCGGDASGSQYKMTATGKNIMSAADIEMLTLPLCNDCGPIHEQVKHAHFWGRGKLPNEMTEKWREIEKCVHISIPKFSLKSSIIVEFKNDVFGQKFAELNGTTLI
jgi:hypothetical protein